MNTKALNIDRHRVPTTEGSRVEVEIHDLNHGNLSHVSPLYQQWMKLFDRDPKSDIVQHPEYVLKQISFLEDDVSRPPVLITAHRDGDLVGLGVLIPKEESTRQISLLCPSFSVPGYILSGSRFLGEQDEEIHRDFLSASLKYIANSGSRFLLIEDLIINTPFGNICYAMNRKEGCLFLPKGVQARLQTQFSHELDYWSKFNSKSRSGFRRKIKNFGAHTVVRVTDVDQVADFLENANQISQNSWQGDCLGIRVDNSDEELDLLSFLATEGVLRSYMLFKGDVPAAFVIGKQHNGRFDYSELAYDRQFASQSPGQVLLLKILDDLLETNTPEWLDFGGGDAEYKRRFGNHESESGNVWLIPRSFQNSVLIGLFHASRAIDSLARRLLEMSGLKKTVRQFIRRTKATKVLNG